MKRTFLISAAMTGILLSHPVLAADDSASSESTSKTHVEQDSNGDYHKKHNASAESTDVNGTTTKTETSVKADTKANGDENRSVTTETSTDPKGLMNKTLTKTSDSVKTKDGKTEIKHKKKVNGSTVEETTQEDTVTH